MPTRPLKYTFLLLTDLGLAAAVLLFVVGWLNSQHYSDMVFYACVAAYAGIIVGCVLGREWNVLGVTAFGAVLGILPYLDYAGYHINQGFVVYAWVLFGVISLFILLAILGAHAEDRPLTPSLPDDVLPPPWDAA